jgi:hypothetical protein
MSKFKQIDVWQLLKLKIEPEKCQVDLHDYYNQELTHYGAKCDQEACFLINLLCPVCGDLFHTFMCNSCKTKVFSPISRTKRLTCGTYECISTAQMCPII